MSTTEFHKDNSKARGHKAHCRGCFNSKQRLDRASRKKALWGVKWNEIQLLKSKIDDKNYKLNAVNHDLQICKNNLKRSKWTIEALRKEKQELVINLWNKWDAILALQNDKRMLQSDVKSLQENIEMVIKWNKSMHFELEKMRKEKSVKIGIFWLMIAISIILVLALVNSHLPVNPIS